MQRRLPPFSNFQHGERLTEREVAIRLIGRAEYIDDPDLLRSKNGFSLLDLKRVVAEYGYAGTGLGKMTFEELDERAPAIVPTNMIGYSHYVVYRGQLSRPRSCRGSRLRKQIVHTQALHGGLVRFS